MKTYRQVDFSRVDITGGFWRDRQAINRDVTMDSVRSQFEQTGRMAAFKFDWTAGRPGRPHIFWDSDVAKWMESAAYILRKNRNADLEKYVDDLVSLIERNQCADGYFNIYFTVVEPEERWTRRAAHELYCAGHLIEAAAAYYEATGKDAFLRCMRRYADYIEKTFKDEKSAEFSTPGHEEIELALVKLYRVTGERRYLELSKFFIDARGRADSKEVMDGDNDEYAQDHVPVREQETAEGHCVRACYLYSGMADAALETGDEPLLASCEALFRNIAERRAYITGGIGSTRDGERFTGDYDLPNETAYAETCAAISLAMFAGRMSLLSPKSVYADMVERTLYNGIISGISLDGKSFFYENPLEINLAERAVPFRSRKWPAVQRAEGFECSCCPPNVTRFIASIGGTLYSNDDDTLFVHQFMESNAELSMGGASVQIGQSTSYPDDGAVALRVLGMRGKTLAVRVPFWCDEFTLSAPYEIRDGYAYMSVTDDDFSVSYVMDMKPKWYESSCRVWENAGKVALMRGPVVYCLEGVDNGGGLWNFSADMFEPVAAYTDEALGITCLSAGGYKKASCECERAELYRPASGNYLPVKLKFIPYYAFANRGESDMAVWVSRF